MCTRRRIYLLFLFCLFYYNYFRKKRFSSYFLNHKCNTWTWIKSPWLFLYIIFFNTKQKPGWYYWELKQNKQMRTLSKQNQNLINKCINHVSYLTCIISVICSFRHLSNILFFLFIWWSTYILADRSLRQSISLLCIGLWGRHCPNKYEMNDVNDYFK